MQNLINRLREPSTWAGIGGLLSLTGHGIDDSTLQALTQAGTGLAWLVAICMSETK